MIEKEFDAQKAMDFLIHSDKTKAFVKSLLKPAPSVIEFLKMNDEEQEKTIKEYQENKVDAAEKFESLIDSAAKVS